MYKLLSVQISDCSEVREILDVLTFYFYLENVLQNCQHFVYVHDIKKTLPCFPLNVGFSFYEVRYCCCFGNFSEVLFSAYDKSVSGFLADYKRKSESVHTAQPFSRT